jgi:GNAT superfamily N-acetyltransferase
VTGGEAVGVVRLARPDDAADLVRVHLACWREAYGHLLSEQFLAAREADAERRTQRWREGIAGGDAPWLAVADGAVVGLALAVDPSAPVAARTDLHEAADQPPGLELAMLYVLASHHGTGLGQQLLDAAVGSQPCSLWVAEDNPRARAFYERNGFRADGAHRTEPTFEDMAIVRLVRP